MLFWHLNSKLKCLNNSFTFLHYWLPLSEYLGMVYAVVVLSGMCFLKNFQNFLRTRCDNVVGAPFMNQRSA